MTQSERQARVVSLLQDSVRTELQVVNGIENLGLSDANIEHLVEGVTSGILYAFNVDWAPNWVKPGEVHTWEEEGRWFARCSACLADSPASETEQQATSWAHEHETAH